MNLIKMIAILQIVTGILILLYGKYSLNHGIHNAKWRTVRQSHQDKDIVYIPVWIWFGAGAITIGFAILLVF